MRRQMLPKSGKKKARAKQKPAAPHKAPSEASQLKTVALVPGPAIVEASNVNVRGQARLKGEVVTRLTKGQAVTVLEEIVNNNSAADEPSAWAKILLPPEVPVWVNSSFLDSNRTVLPKKLNVRNGPGENYSVLGLVFRGETLKELGNKGEWLKVEAPTNAYGFIAAQYLKQDSCDRFLRFYLHKGETDALARRTEDDQARGWTIALQTRFEDPGGDLRTHAEVRVRLVGHDGAAHGDVLQADGGAVEADLARHRASARRTACWRIAGDDKGLYALAQHRIGHRHAGDVLHRRMTENQIFDFFGADLLSAAVDQVFLAPGDAQILV